MRNIVTARCQGGVDDGQEMEINNGPGGGRMREAKSAHGNLFRTLRLGLFLSKLFLSSKI